MSETTAAARAIGGVRLPTRVENARVGILYMIGATLLFAISNALARSLVAKYPVGEFMFMRSLGSLLCCSSVVLPIYGMKVFVTRRPLAHVGRGVSQAVSQTFTVVALSMMSFASVTAIGFTAPLFSALLSILFLGERRDMPRLATLAAGICGALIVAPPDAEMFRSGAIFALANAVIYGSVTVAVRGMTNSESTATLLMWQMLVLAICHGLLLSADFVVPAPADGALLFATGAANATAQFFWTRSLSLAPASSVSPFYYLLLVWSMIIGFVAWDEIPTPSMLGGSVIIVAAGFALVVREGRGKPD